MIYINPTLSNYHLSHHKIQIDTSNNSQIYQDIVKAIPHYAVTGLKQSDSRYLLHHHVLVQERLILNLIKKPNPYIINRSQGNYLEIQDLVHSQ